MAPFESWLTVVTVTRNSCCHHARIFLDIISPNNDMLDKVNKLFATFPEVDKVALGFPVGWENEPLWK